MMTIKEKTNNFNSECAYDMVVSQLVEDLVATCREHGLPIVVSVVFSKEDDRVGITTAWGGRDGVMPGRLAKAVKLLLADENVESLGSLDVKTAVVA